MPPAQHIRIGASLSQLFGIKSVSLGTTERLLRVLQKQWQSRSLEEGMLAEGEPSESGGLNLGKQCGGLRRIAEDWIGPDMNSGHVQHNTDICPLIEPAKKIFSVDQTVQANSGGTQEEARKPYMLASCCPISVSSAYVPHTWRWGRLPWC